MTPETDQKADDIAASAFVVGLCIGCVIGSFFDMLLMALSA